MTTAPRVDMGAMCCLCMTEEEVVLFGLRQGQVPPRFEVPNPVINKIRKLFNINMLQEGMPDKICHNCLIKVDMFYNFNAIVEAGQYKLMVLTRQINKFANTETPEGSKTADNPVLPFSKYQKYGLMRPVETAQDGTPVQSGEGQTGNKDGMITVTRPNVLDVPKPVRIRMKPYSIPQVQPSVPETPPAPKLKSVTLNLQDLVLLRPCKLGGTVSLTPQHPSQQKLISQLLSNNSSMLPTREGPTPVPPPTLGASTPRPSGSQAREIVTSVGDVEVVVKDEAGEQLRCEVCSESFQLRRPLLRHILTHYQDNIYTCHEADRDCEAKVWFSSFEFREHLVSKHRKQPDNYVVMALSQRAERNSKAEVCTICMASVKGEDSLQQHMREIHKGYYCCNICNKWFLSFRTLQLHMATHEGGKLD